MTKTTNTLAELAPRFDKPRGDRHGIEKGASAETGRAQDTETFSHLVKHSGVEAQRADAVAKQAGVTRGSSQQARQAEQPVERDTANDPESQPPSAKSPMQLKAKLVTAHNAINSTNGSSDHSGAEPSADQKVIGTAQNIADTSLEDDAKRVVAGHADAQTGRLEGTGEAEIAQKDGVGEAAGTGQNEYASRPSETARPATVPQHEAVPPDRARALPLSGHFSAKPARAVASSGVGDRHSDGTGQSAASTASRSAADAAAPGRVSVMPTLGKDADAKSGSSTTSGADEGRSQNSGAAHAMDMDGVERSGADPTRLEALTRRSGDDAKPGSADRTATAASAAISADASTVRRLADAAQVLRRASDRAVRMDSAAESGNTLVERVALQTPDGLPEQRARRAFETVTVQRSLAGGAEMPTVDEDIEIKAPELSVKGAQREGALPATASPGSTAPSAANIYGQLVQSIASADGLPKSGAEFRLLAMQNGIGNTPQPLKVLQLQLQPKELGEVAVRIAMRGDKLELRVQAARQATAELIRSDQRVLVEALQQKNFDIESVTIQVVDPDRSAGSQSGLPNGAQGRAGQGDSFHAASQDQTSRQNSGAGQNDGNGEAEQRDASGDSQIADGAGARHDIYL